MAVDRQRTLHYKKAQLVSGAQVNLQALLQQAIAASGDVENREEPLGAARATRRVLSGVGASLGLFTAKLMQFTAGQKQHFLEKDAAVGDYKLDATAVPGASDDVIREFVESLTFVAVSGAHVMFVATLHLGSKALEDHINWLLKGRGLIAQDDFLLLQDQRSLAADARLARHPVDKVIIGADLEFEIVEQVGTQRRTRDRETIPGHKKVRPVGPIADALGPLLGDWMGDVPLSLALGRDERIAVKLELNYSNRRKTDEGFEMMQKLAVAGRHFDMGETTVRLHKGGYLRNDDLQVQTPITVRVLDSGLIDDFDLWGRVHAWLRHAVATGIVHQ